MNTLDLLVIGAGSGGVAASRRAAQLGANVAICEKSRVGGTCVIRGCVPKKLFVHASEYQELFSGAEGFGWTAKTPSFDWKTLKHNKDKEINRLNGIYKTMLENSGVELIEGEAQFSDSQTVTINGLPTQARHILIATGGTPSIPDIEGAELGMSSDDMFELEQLPKKIVIIGGGYIAVEFACIFNGLGVEVELLHRGDLILRGFDTEMRRYVAEEMSRRGITLRYNTQPKRLCASTGGIKKIECVDGSVSEADCVLFATGRSPNTAPLNTEAAGIKLLANGAIKVDDWHRTSVGHIFAVGDVTDKVPLTPVAIEEGRALADTLFGTPRKVNYKNIATAIFSQPCLASVGLTEEEARMQHTDISLYKAFFRPLKHTLSGSEEKILMKVIVNERNDRVLGIHMVGTDAAEIIQSLAVAMQCSVTKAQLDSTMALHPCSAEEFVTMREKAKEN